MPALPGLGKLQLRPGDLEPTVDQLLRTPLFANASDVVVRRLGRLRGKSAAVLRRYEAGAVVCRQGDPGWTAFYILRDADIRRLAIPMLDGGAAEDAAPAGVRRGRRDSVVPSVPSVTIDQLLLAEIEGHRVKAEISIAPVETARQRRPVNLLDRFRDRVWRSKRPRTIAVDASADVVQKDGGPATGYLREGQLFGEMSCFNHTRRSATVRATEACYVLEMTRGVLSDALENKAFRNALDQIYRKRVLETHLASMPAFENASREALEVLQKGAELVTYRPGDTIFREGDPADAMYFIRHGTVKLFREAQGGRILGYRSRGEAIGGGSLLAGEPRQMSCQAHDPRKPGEARPLKSAVAGRVELVRIRREVFDEVCAAFPELKDNARHLVSQRSLHSLQPSPDLAVESLAGSLGLSQAERVMLIDLDRCTRCDDCVRACADTHDGVSLLNRDGPRFGSYLIPGTCRQCLDPTCLLGCPVGSIHRGADGEIVVEDWCIGCGICEEQCPYDAIKLEGEMHKAHVCDQCASLGTGEPMCVYACPHDAAERVDGRSFFAQWVRRG